MEHHAGLDVSLNETSDCIVDGAGKIIRETRVASEPEALVGYFSSLEIKVVRIGLEAGPLSQWLYAALTQAGYAVVLLVGLLFLLWSPTQRASWVPAVVVMAMSRPRIAGTES